MLPAPLAVPLEAPGEIQKDASFVQIDACTCQFFPTLGLFPEGLLIPEAFWFVTLSLKNIKLAVERHPNFFSAQHSLKRSNNKGILMGFHCLQRTWQPSSENEAMSSFSVSKASFRRQTEVNDELLPKKRDEGSQKGRDSFELCPKMPRFCFRVSCC